jgi:hypothetical protein
LQKIIAAHGAAPERWPPTERAAAIALARQLPQARAWLDEATRLDGHLDAWQVQPADPALHARILAAAAANPRDIDFWSWLDRLWPASLRLATIGGFACAAVLGLVLGLSFPPDRKAEPGDLSALFLEIEEGDLEL